MSTINSAKKSSKKGRPEVDSEAVNVRLRRDLVMAIDRARRDIESLPNRPEMIRIALAEWLSSKGYVD